MLKSFADRYASMRALVETALAFTVAHGREIQALRRITREQGRTQREWPVHWAMDEAKSSQFRFKGYAAKYKPSVLGTYSRLWYDRSEPWERDIAYYNRFAADVTVTVPRYYVVPQAWREVIERLVGNSVYSKLKFESGGHRVQRVPATETQGRIHTSACTVAVMPEADEVEDVNINPADLRVDTFRASVAGTRCTRWPPDSNFSFE